jgi:catechol 2,3-dioxygenase
MPELGHVVFYVRDLQRSLAFYRDGVGLRCVGELFGGRAAALTGGRTHHELLLIQAGDAPGPLRGRRLGLYHVGWKVGDTLDDLRAVRSRLGRQGIPVAAAVDHHVSQSLYLHDPDGNEVELYVDRPDYDWRARDDWLQMPPVPLDL